MVPWWKRSCQRLLRKIHNEERWETTSAVAIYEGFGAWSTCKRWIERLSDIGLSPDELAVVRNSLERRRLVTIQEVRASLDEIELLGLHRADGSK